MVQGTSSSAGKSAITAGLLRYFSNKGVSCSPFKSQNMSLNSFVTEDGFEISSAQAVQCEAAFKKPLRQVNPILIKPASDTQMHLIVEGKHYGNMNFKEYNGKKDFFVKKAAESFDFLAGANDLIVVEGAGSPAEINLFKYDIANMGFAQIYDIPVILTADIERGGVFASIYGTVKLLPPKWRRLIKGFIINKFRGDASILESGIKDIEKRLKIPCLGVIPHIKNLSFEAEDSLELKASCGRQAGYNGGRIDGSGNGNKIKIGIVRLDRISNFNEFDPLFLDGRINARFFDSVPYVENDFDIVVIPGSKSTISDLLSIKRSKVFDYIKNFEKYGIIMGICGGFQMMGESIKDQGNIESSHEKDEAGLGFFRTETVLSAEKVLLNRRYIFRTGNAGRESLLTGYEIHNGRTFFTGDHNGSGIRTNVFVPSGETPHNFSPENGIISEDGKKIGTYIHGLFANADFKNFLIGTAEKNLKSMGKDIDLNLKAGKPQAYETVKNESFNLLSENIENHIDIKLLRNIIGI